jgi:hypothetical protein
LEVTVGGGYTPANNDLIYIIWSSGAGSTLTGPFSSVSVPSNWVNSYSAHAKITYSTATGLENQPDLTAKVYSDNEHVIVNLGNSLVAQLEIIDLTGRTVIKKMVNAENCSVNMGNLKGIYIARLTTGLGNYSQKICLK